MAKYSTNFASDENPLSESGSWIQGAVTGLDWTDVRASGGFAYGTEPGDINYNDSVACLTGSWGWHQRALGVIQINDQVSGGGANPFIEAELLLHFSITANDATGYELTISNDATDHYIHINRWNGALGDFTPLTSGTMGTAGFGTVVASGDLFEFRDEGTASVPLLCVYQNGIKLTGLTYDTTPDTTKYTAGSPGIGFYDGNATVPNSFQNYVQWARFDASDSYFDGEAIQSTGTAPSTSASSTTQAFSADVTQGNLLVAVGWHGGTHAGTFADTRGNTWTVITSATNATDGHQLDLAIAIAKDSGASTVTYTHSGDSATQFRAIAVAEYQAAWTADKTASATGNSGTPSSGATATTTSATELVLGAFGGSNTAADAPISTQNFVSRTDVIGGPNTRWLLSLLDRLAYSTAAFTNAATVTSQQWSALVATLQLVASQTQLNYRFRFDDGDEASATWMAPEQTDVRVGVGRTFRLRLQVDTAGDEPSQPLTLQYRKVGDSTWSAVT